MNSDPELNVEEFFRTQGEHPGAHPRSLLSTIPADSIAMKYLRDSLAHVADSPNFASIARELASATLRGEVSLIRMLDETLFPLPDTATVDATNEDLNERGIRWA